MLHSRCSAARPCTVIAPLACLLSQRLPSAVRLDDPAVVRSEYADDKSLATRQSIWVGATGVEVHDLVVGAIGGYRRVLEVGCGRGELAERLSREPGVSLIAVDQSERMMPLTRARGVEAIVGDVQDLPFSDGEFDAAVAAWMLYHAPDLDRALSELARVLRPGGRLVAVTNSSDNLRELWALVGWTSDYSFSADNGKPLLRNHFSLVEEVPVQGTVTFSDRETAVRYVSASIRAKHLAEQLPLDEWPLVCTRSMALFIAEK
jgi:ubiquinone/menaquinone biosynthesis C-methylase UbiE